MITRDDYLDQLFWQLNDQARAEADGSAEKQHDKLVELLLKQDIETINALSDIEHEYRARYQNNPEYDLLHISNGGFVGTGDDGFYMDFGSWLVAQGKDLLEAFEEKGHEAIEEYIKQNDIGPLDYRFESICYAYHRAADILESPSKKSDIKWC